MHKVSSFAIAVLLTLQLHAQTIGLIQNTPGNLDGYVLFFPNTSDTTYLIDKCGYRIHAWPSSHPPALSAYLLDDGSILRTAKTNNPVFSAGGQGGIIERIDWNGNVTWTYTISNSVECQHHDIFPMQNGNVLVIAYDLKTPADLVSAGRDTNHIGTSLWSEKIIELQPVGANSANIVWEWKLWDHIIQSNSSGAPNYGVPSQHPELINLNFYTGSATSNDWHHFNSIDYDETLDQIIVSSHNFCELYIIDHSTTTQEAAAHSGGRYGKGGDLLYRWGNPLTYGRGTITDKKLFGQHYPHRISAGLKDAGSVMIFNNGVGRPGGNYSSVDVISLPMDSTGVFSVPATGPFLPDSAYWKYTAPVPAAFYAVNISGAQRLENGNTLICTGPSGTFFEIDSLKNTVWKYICPTGQGGNLLTQGSAATANPVFRCTQYPTTHPAFAGRTLTPGPPIELNPIAYSCSMSTGTAEVQSAHGQGLHLLNFGNARYALSWEGASETVDIRLYNLNGQQVMDPQVAAVNNDLPTELLLPESLPKGIFILNASIGSQSWNFRILK